MDKNELITALYSGCPLSTLFSFSERQGVDVYKGEWQEEYEKRSEIIFIKETDVPLDRALSEDEIDDLMPRVYSTWDFIDLCNGNVPLAEYLFGYVEYENPQMAIDEDFSRFSDEEMVEICDETYGQVFLGEEKPVDADAALEEAMDCGYDSVEEAMEALRKM